MFYGQVWAGDLQLELGCTVLVVRRLQPHQLELLAHTAGLFDEGLKQDDTKSVVPCQLCVHMGTQAHVQIRLWL